LFLATSLLGRRVGFQPLANQLIVALLEMRRALRSKRYVLLGSSLYLGFDIE
jgi:hypothetical protein